MDEFLFIVIGLLIVVLVSALCLALLCFMLDRPVESVLKVVFTKKNLVWGIYLIVLSLMINYSFGQYTQAMRCEVKGKNHWTQIANDTYVYGVKKCGQGVVMAYVQYPVMVEGVRLKSKMFNIYDTTAGTFLNIEYTTFDNEGTQVSYGSSSLSYDIKDEPLEHLYLLEPPIQGSHEEDIIKYLQLNY